MSDATVPYCIRCGRAARVVVTCVCGVICCSERCHQRHYTTRCDTVAAEAKAAAEAKRAATELPAWATTVGNAITTAAFVLACALCCVCGVPLTVSFYRDRPARASTESTQSTEATRPADRP